MDYATPLGQEAQGEDAIYIDGNPEAGIEGSAVPAKAIEPGMRELINLIRFAGLTPDGADLEQVRKAIGMLIESAAPDIATLLENGICRPDGLTTQISAEGLLSAICASAAEVLAGSDENKLITPVTLLGGFPNMTSTSGWQKLPGGLILQWGAFQTSTSGYTTLTFPIAFPNAMLAITGAVQGATNISQLAISTIFFQPAGKLPASIPCAAYTATSGTFFVCGLYWVAIGY